MGLSSRHMRRIQYDDFLLARGVVAALEKAVMNHTAEGSREREANRHWAVELVYLILQVTEWQHSLNGDGALADLGKGDVEKKWLITFRRGWLKAAGGVV